ncbi:MAG: restriction endonuclease subunit S [Novosphingobium sp.]
MSDWTTSTLEEGLDRLIDYRGKSPPKSVTGIPVISAKVVKTSGLLKPIEQTISPDYYSTWMTRGLPQIGDVVLTTEGPLGEVIQLDAESVTYALGQRVVCLRGKTSVLDNTFLRYLLTSPAQQEILASYATGTTVAGISQKALRSIPISYPSVEEQRRLGEVLCALDDKIDFNRRTNETLETMAQAIFRDWFVDFGPVRRKMAGTTDPVAIMGGLMPDPTRATELAVLFPDALGDDDLPLGWTAGDFGDLATTAGESVDPTRLGEHTPYIGLEHMPRRSISLDNWDYAGKVSSQKSRFSSGQVLFGKLRPYFHKVGIAPVDGVCSTDIVVLDSRTDFDRELIACCASSDAFVAFTDLTSSGTKMPRTSWSHMKTYELAIADAPVRRAFSEIIRPMHQKVVGSVGENRNLAETRDYLLPRLMSGEVRVGDGALEIAA